MMTRAQKWKACSRPIQNITGIDTDSQGRVGSSSHIKITETKNDDDGSKVVSSSVRMRGARVYKPPSTGSTFQSLEI